MRNEYIVDPASGCWLWQKNIRKGYGRAWKNGKLVSAHVWFWEQAHGAVPEGLDLDHMCHNRATDCAGGDDCQHRRCVNPDHLLPATRSENIRRGIRGRRGKLTEAQVAEIKQLHHLPARDVAARFGVSRPTIAAIRTGRIWSDVEGPAPVARKSLGAPALTRTTPLTEEEVLEIKSAPQRYGIGRELAHKFGVSDAWISAIRTGHSRNEGSVI